MKYIKLPVIGVAIIAAAGCATKQSDENLAQASANNWVALVDSGKYDTSWNEAAPIFKAAVSKPKWAETITAIRNQTGKTTSRKIRSIERATSLPGVPQGEYYVIKFDTNFANAHDCIETITPMRDKDGSWKVSGYFVK